MGTVIPNMRPADAGSPANEACRSIVSGAGDIFPHPPQLCGMYCGGREREGEMRGNKIDGFRLGGPTLCLKASPAAVWTPAQQQAENGANAVESSCEKKETLLLFIRKIHVYPIDQPTLIMLANSLRISLRISLSRAAVAA